MSIFQIPISLDKKKILKRLGFSSRKSLLTPPMKKLIEQELRRCDNIIQPQALITHYDIVCTTPQTVSLTGPDILFISTSLVKHLNNCEKVSLFACTIGEKINTEITHCFSKNQQSRGVILDGIGSVAVEELAEGVNRLASKMAHQNGRIAIQRFSPGYQDWALQEQKKIFQLIDPSQIGITLTESCIMKPEKSITGIIGWKKE